MKKTIALILLFLFISTTNSFSARVDVGGGGGGGVTISDTAYSAAWNGNTTDGASKNALYDKIETLSSGSSKWTTNSNIIHPNNSATDEVVIGGTTEGTADIFLGADGTTKFNEQQNNVDFGIDGNTVENLFQVDASDDDIEMNGGLNINLPADDNVVIDGRSNPRTITPGILRINHTPEGATQNTRGLFIDSDANSVPNTQGMHIDMKATGIVAGETIIGIDIVGDTANSSGGVIRLLEFDKTGTGSAEVHAMHVEPGIEEVIHHASGTFIDPTQAWDENGGFVDVTTAFGTSDIGGANNVIIFSANADAIYIGAEAVFNEVNVTLETGASNPGIKPTFEIWTGASWTTITPVDNTAGFRESGIIDLEGVDTSSWVANTVNSVSKVYLRITRTQGGSLTIKEDLIQTVAATDFIWDGNGNVNVKSLLLVDELTITSGTADLINLNPSNTGSQSIIDIMPSAALVAGSTWRGFSIDGNALDPLTGAASAVHALHADFSGFNSADGNAEVHIIHFDYPTSDSATGVHSEFGELTNNSTVRNIHTDMGNLVLSATATYVGHEVSMENVTRDANAPVLQGIKIRLPADYTNFGTSYAGYFEGGGENVTMADGTYALNASGNTLTSGTVFVGVGLDAVGAVDLDYGSADVTDHTFVSDGGTVIMDGSIVISGDGTQSSITEGLVVNAGKGGDADDDFTVHGGTIDDLLTVDASTDRVGVGTATPLLRLHVVAELGIGGIKVERQTTGSAFTDGLRVMSVRTTNMSAGFGTSIKFYIKDDTSGEELIGEMGYVRGNADTEGAFVVNAGTNGGEEFFKINQLGTQTLTPQASAPAACSIGDIYIDTSGAACACASTNTWENMISTGTCS